METRKSKPIRRPLPKETRMLKQQAKKRAGLLVLSGLFFILIGYSLGVTATVCPLICLSVGERLRQKN